MEESKIVIQDHELNDEELDGISGGADQGAKKPCKTKGCQGYSSYSNGLCSTCYKKMLDNMYQIMNGRKKP